MRAWREAKLTERQRALAAYAEKLTLTPRSMRSADLEALRVVGLDDRDILDAVEVISFFNYINRVADALGVDLEPGMEPRPEDAEDPDGPEAGRPG